MFLQLGEVQAHSKAIEATKNTKVFAQDNKSKQMHATTTATLDIDDTEHIVDAALTTMNKDKIAIWGYSMTQYNLKTGLRKFGLKVTNAAITELSTQLHVMDTRAVMNPSKLT